ncbi:MAG: hypothetical protein A4E53_02123 [Pelotomaculum sp. PtaB.Bin104]|nr:MAG: hypothetical protein A4E53_02123 [Pelotomaculum sp. PtaB.Bin104]
MAKKKKKKDAGVPGRSCKSAPVVTINQQKILPFSDSFHTTTHFYRNNMQILKKHYPELARRVEQCAFTPRYRLMPSLRPDGTPNLYCAEKNSLYYDNADPLLDAKLQLAALRLKNAKLAIFLGVGLGYEIIHFALDIADTVGTKAIIIIEKDLELFKLACCYTDLTTLIAHPMTFFLIGVDEDELYVPLKNKLKESGWFIYSRALKPLYHPSSLRLEKEYYLTALKAIRDASLHTVTDFGNCPEDSLIGVENMLANLSVIIRNPGINQLYGAFRNKPAIVVATGPSLNKNKHLLKGLEKRALMISVDASLKILLEMGVKPHLVTALERVIEVARFFRDIPLGELDDVYLAACPVIRREVYNLYSGPKIIVYRAFDHFKWLGVDRGMLNIKGSAGNMAFKIAAALGCNPIILVGQDLAFSRKGATHASGHALGEKQDAFYRDVLEVTGNDGSPIQTSDTLYGFLKGYEVDLAEYEGTCINATEGGAFIQGTRVMPLAEAIKRYLRDEFDPLETLNRHLMIPDESKNKETLRQVLEKIDHTMAELERIERICKNSLKMIKEKESLLNQAAADRNATGQVKEFMAKIYEQKRNCALDHDTYQLFFMHVIQSFNIKFEMEMQVIPETHDNESVALAETALRHTEWFATIGRLADTCRKTLHKYRELLYFDFPAE